MWGVVCYWITNNSTHQSLSWITELFMSICACTIAWAITFLSEGYFVFLVNICGIYYLIFDSQYYRSCQFLFSGIIFSLDLWCSRSWLFWCCRGGYSMYNLVCSTSASRICYMDGKVSILEWLFVVLAALPIYFCTALCRSAQLSWLTLTEWLYCA